MKILPFLFGVMLLSAGCVQWMHTPAEFRSISLEHVSSAKVSVPPFEVVRYKGQVRVVGIVRRTSFDGDTSKTHLDVSLFAADGTRLRSSTASFQPRQIMRGFRMPGRSNYELVLEPLPTGVGRIEVRAHDGEHASLSSQ